MRKWLVALFLLLITTFGVIGFVSSTQTNGVEVEQHLPSNTESIK